MLLFWLLEPPSPVMHHFPTPPHTCSLRLVIALRRTATADLGTLGGRSDERPSRRESPSEI